MLLMMGRDSGGRERNRGHTWRTALLVHTFHHNLLRPFGCDAFHMRGDFGRGRSRPFRPACSSWFFLFEGDIGPKGNCFNRQKVKRRRRHILDSGSHECITKACFRILMYFRGGANSKTRNLYVGRLDAWAIKFSWPVTDIRHAGRRHHAVTVDLRQKSSYHLS